MSEDDRIMGCMNALTIVSRQKRTYKLFTGQRLIFVIVHHDFEYTFYTAAIKLHNELTEYSTEALITYI